MLKIRLMRIGAKQKPFYRIVVVDERNKRDGAYLDLLGTYNPLTEPKDIKLDKEKMAAWLKKGAQKSDGLLRMLKEAPPRPPRKPKKEKKKEESSVVSPQPSEELKTEEKPQPETGQPLAEKEETPATERPAEANVEEVKVDNTVIASEAKQSSPEENPDKIATEPSAPRNDKVVESEKKDEGSA